MGLSPFQRVFHDLSVRFGRKRESRTPSTDDTVAQKSDDASVPDVEILHITGLRGLFTIQTFLWVFLSTFAPAAVKGNDHVDGPFYQDMLRKTVSVLFWNGSLIYGAFIILSGRTVLLPFFKSPTKQTAASLIFRRTFRFLLPAAVALAIVAVVQSQVGQSHIVRFKEETGNTALEIPLRIDQPLVYFNSLFEIFWVNKLYFTQSASLGFPTQTLWMLSAIYQQSYTVYMTMIVIPYTRNSWRVKAFIFFILTAWWVQSWAWYTVTGILLADVVHHMGFQRKSPAGMPMRFGRAHRGFKLYRIPTWCGWLLLMTGGLIMQYLFTAWRPDLQDNELYAHTGLYTDGKLNSNYDPKQPQARDDNYLLLLGLFLWVETSDTLQYALSNRLFVFLGRRSLSYFLVAPILAYELGIQLFNYFRLTLDWPVEMTNVAVLLICLATTAIGAEIMYWLVEQPSVWAGKKAWKFLST
ncbi:hypothetical protein BDY21DRAFT_422152 [Lineolata rhizophorae]|uniref:Acyltransferase 3 domain-containing protein n=1 Tax=Lineolata rhizophorae TaxID=578093 RepID=A0A6A6NZR7_9PEZI|nr:hypothetical protein BDY21DRAFT_422152 [Lineolata rhizophorae]